MQVEKDRLSQFKADFRPQVFTVPLLIELHGLIIDNRVMFRNYWCCLLSVVAIGNWACMSLQGPECVYKKLI